MAILKAGKWTYTEEELEQMFAESDRRGQESLKTEIQAREARYDHATGRLVLELKSGATHSVPCHLMQGLRDANPADIAAVELGPRGASLHWEKLDADFTVGGLVRGIYGTKKWMAELARLDNRNKARANRPASVRERKTAVASASKRGRAAG